MKSQSGSGRSVRRAAHGHRHGVFPSVIARNIIINEIQQAGDFPNAGTAK